MASERAPLVSAERGVRQLPAPWVSQPRVRQEVLLPLVLQACLPLAGTLARSLQEEVQEL